MAENIVMIDAVQLSPPGTGWRMFTLGDLVGGGLPEDVSGIILRAHNSGTTNYYFGVRPYGSSESYGYIDENAQMMRMSAVDAQGRFEVYFGSTTYTKVYLVGYTRKGFYYAATPVDKSIGYKTSYQTISCQADIPSGDRSKTIGVLINVYASTTLYYFNLRYPGSEDDFQYDAFKWCSGTFIVKCNSSQEIQMIIEDFSVDCNFMGYVTTESGLELYDDSVDYSLASAGSELNKTLPAGAKGGLFRIFTSDNQTYYLQKKGYAGADADLYKNVHRHINFLVAGDANREVEGKISSTNVQFKLLGIWKDVGGKPKHQAFSLFL